MKSNVYIISILMGLTIHTVSQSMEAPGRANDNGLLEASRKGEKARIISLLESGYNVDTTDAKGMQPIHHAAFKGHTAIVEQLLDRGATGIDSPDTNARQPLHWAAWKGHRATVELLLNRGATGIDAPDKRGRQPLHWATWNGHRATVELLLDRGATGIDSPGNDGRQPLHYAAWNGHTAAVELLVDRGATGIDAPSGEGWQPLHWATLKGHTATVITLISHGAAIPDTMPLHRAMAKVFAQSDFASIPPIPFGRGPERTLTLSNVFRMAAGQNKQATIQTILRLHRTNLTDSNIIDALIGSATAGHDEMVRRLHNEMSNDINLRFFVPETIARGLSRAVAHCRVDVIGYLIEQDSTYDTPTFSLLRPAGTLLRNILNPYTPTEIAASERLSNHKRILAMLSERQYWQSHTLPLLGHAQGASVDREETLSHVPSPIIRIPIELWLIILNYLADRHLHDIAK